MLGTTRETVSRVLADFQRRGYVRQSGRHLLLHNDFLIETEAPRSGKRSLATSLRPAMPRTTISKDLVFSGAHAVAFTHGGSERRHGHNWRLRVTLGATELDSAGMIMDFSELKKHARVILDRFEHRDLNETPPFDKLNLTAENIAGLVFEELSKHAQRRARLRRAGRGVGDTTLARDGRALGVGEDRHHIREQLDGLGPGTLE